MPQAIPAVIAAISYVGTATAAVVAGTATLAQIATVAAVGIGAGVGGMASAKALTPQIGSQGAAVQWIADPDEPLRFAFGRVGVKGSIKDAAVYGPDRMYVSFACTVSAAGPIKSFVNFRAGDYYMSFDGAGKALNEPYRDEMWFATRLGAQPDTALPLPSGLKSGASFPDWNSTRRFSGSAAYMVTLGENSKRSAYGGKIPAFVATIEGLYCYDPRLDSTYPGGSGACRLNDPATWVWTQNPILFALKWALGLWEGPTGKGAPQVDYQVGGIGAKVESILLHTAVEAANVAAANGWTAAAWPSTDDDKAQVLDGFLKAGGAMYAEIAGKMAFIHRAAPRAPVFTVTARDTAGPVEIDTASSKLNRINTLRPRYWSEAHEWEMTALPEVTSTVWQEEDGQGVAVKRTRGADFSFVPQAKQARELASLEISHSREGIRGRVPLRPYMDPEPGNCFIFDEPDFALSNLKCFVLNVDDDTDDDTIVVTFETETDGKYPFAYGQTGSPPPAQELDPRDPTFVSPPLPDDWDIVITPPTPGGGGQLPGFDLTGGVSNSTATAVLVEWAPTSDGPWTQAYQGPPTVERIPVTGVQPGGVYFIAVTYFRGQNSSARQVYGPYTAPNLVADDTTHVGGVPTDLFRDLPTAVEGLETALDEAAADVAALNAEVYTATTGLKARTTSLWADVNTTTTGLKARSNAMFADINTATTGLKAQTASLLASLNTPTTGVLARLTATENATSSNNSAAVTRLNALEATVNTASTGLVARMASAESAITGNNSAAVTRLNALEATVNTAGTGLSAKVSGLQTAVTDLQSGKASASDLAALTTRVTTAEGVNTAQNTRLNTVETDVAGKASAARVSLLEAQVQTVGTGLLARMATQETTTADLATGKADAARVSALEASINTPGTGLLARILTSETAITALDGSKASTTRVAMLEALSRVGFNAIKNSSASAGLQGWTRYGSLTIQAGPEDAAGAMFFHAGATSAATGNAVQIGIPATPGAWSFQAEMTSFNLTSGSVRAYVQYVNGSGSVLASQTLTSTNNTGWTRYKNEAFAAPAGTVEARVTIDYTGATFTSGGSAGWRRLKLETGPICTAWSDDGTIVQAAARLTTAESAITTNNTAAVTRLSALEASVNTAGTGVLARLGTAESAISTNNSATVTRLNALEATVNTAGTGLSAKITGLQTTVSNLETNKAEATRVASIEAALNTSATGVLARLTTAENAIVTSNSATVGRVTILEARTTGDSRTGIWPSQFRVSGATIYDWAGLDGLPSRALLTVAASRGVRSVAGYGDVIWLNAYQVFSPVGPGIKCEVGRQYRFRYAFRTTVDRPDGGVSTSYLAFRFLNADYTPATTSNLQAATSSGRVADGWRVGEAIVVIPASAAGRALIRPFIAMNSEAAGSGFGEQECAYVEVTDATESQASNARITAAENAITGNNSAAVTRLNALEATVNTPATGVVARLIAAESAISTNNSAAVNRLSSLEASVNTTGTGLLARVASHDTAISDLNTGKASASSVSQLEARSQSRPNELTNPDFSKGQVGWTSAAGAAGWGIYSSDTVGLYAVTSTDFLASDTYPADPGAELSFSFDSQMGTQVVAYIQWMPSQTTGPQLTNTNADWGLRKYMDSGGLVAPAGTTGWRLVFQRGSAPYIAVTRVKVNYGPKATDYTTEKANQDAYAKITETNLVAVDAQGKANAARTLLLDVNGYVSGTQSINNGVTSAFNVLADAFSVRAPLGGDSTEYLAAYGCWFVYSPLTNTRTRYGKAFNTDQKIVWWTGPSSVAIGSETKGNAYVYISQNTVGGPRFGGSDVPGSNPFTVTVQAAAFKNQVGGSGSITTNAITSTVTGATGTVTWTWANVFGDADVSIFGATTGTPTFSANPVGVGRKQAIFAYTATDNGSGLTRSGDVKVTIMRDA